MRSAAFLPLLGTLAAALPVANQAVAPAEGIAAREVYEREAHVEGTKTFTEVIPPRSATVEARAPGGIGEQFDQAPTSTPTVTRIVDLPPVIVRPDPPRDGDGNPPKPEPTKPKPNGRREPTPTVIGTSEPTVTIHLRDPGLGEDILAQFSSLSQTMVGQEPTIIVRPPPELSISRKASGRGEPVPTVFARNPEPGLGEDILAQFSSLSQTMVGQEPTIIVRPPPELSISRKASRGVPIPTASSLSLPTVTARSPDPNPGLGDDEYVVQTIITTITQLTAPQLPLPTKNVPRDTTVEAGNGAVAQ
jgi:hypothetical protein